MNEFPVQKAVNDILLVHNERQGECWKNKQCTCVTSAEVVEALRQISENGETGQKQDRTINHEFLKLFFPDQQLNFSQTCFILDLDEKIVNFLVEICI